MNRSGLQTGKLVAILLYYSGWEVEGKKWENDYEHIRPETEILTPMLITFKKTETSEVGPLAFDFFIFLLPHDFIGF